MGFCTSPDSSDNEFFNDKYTNGIFIFHRLDENQLKEFVKSVKLCSSEKRRIGVVDVRDRWSQDIAPASCKDHPYVQWYSKGKKIVTPVEVKFQYAKLIGSTLMLRKAVTPPPAMDLLSNTMFVTPSPFLVEQIVQLGRQKSLVEIGKLLQSIDENALYNLVESDLDGQFSTEVTLTGAAGFSAATLFMFKGAGAIIESGQTAAGTRILGTIASACVSQICEDDPKDQKKSGRRWAVVCDKLLEILPQLDPRTVIDTSFRILAELKSCGSTPSVLHGFLPMLLDTLGTVGAVEIINDSDGMRAQDNNADADESSTGHSITRTGSELKAYWVDSACSYRWDARASVAVCALLREISLEEAMIERVGQRMIRQLRLVDLTELPSMVYQLLLFARHGPKRMVLNGIFGFFDSVDDKQPPSEADPEAHKRWRELGDIEGTVMHHFSYSVKQDFELGNALIAYARERSEGASGGFLSTLSFACLLTLARIHRFEDAVTSLLRTIVMKGIHDSLALQATVWVRPYLPSPAYSPQELLAPVVARAAYGWDQVAQTLVQLSLNIVDFSVGAQRRGAYSPGACTEARRVCINALRSAFASHEFVRAELLDQILNRVVFQADSHEHFIELLRDLVADDADLVRPYASKIVDIFDSISVISPASIEQLLNASAPLFLEDPPLRASLTLVLRKILFAQSFDDRRTALSGLFVLASQHMAALDAFERLSGSGSELDNRSRRRIDELLSASLETLGLLRRCLTQQPEVRVISYEKLAQLLDASFVGRSSVLTSALNDMFRSEFSKYYCQEKTLDSPINIQMCVNPNTYKVTMPVANFLQCFSKLTLARSNANSGGSSMFRDEWGDICERFSKVQIEDFELDPTGDYMLSSPYGLRNYNTALLVIGCLDASLQHALLYGIQRASDADSMLDLTLAINRPELAMELFSKFCRFGDVLMSRCLDDRKKRIIGAMEELSTMTLPTVVNILRAILPGCSTGSGSGNVKNFVSLWVSNNRFIRYLLEVALARIQRRTLAGFSAGASRTVPPAPEASTVLELAYVVYFGVIAHYCSASPGDDSLDLPSHLQSKGSRSRSVLYLCSEILGACASNLWDRGMIDSLSVALARPGSETSSLNIAPNDACSDMSVLVARLWSAVQTLMAQRPMAIKESVSVMAILQLLAGRLAEIATAAGGDDDKDSNQRAQIAIDCLKVCASRVVGIINNDITSDIGLLKSVMGLLVRCQPFSQQSAASSDMRIVGWSNSASAAPPPCAVSSLDGKEMAPINHLVVNASIASGLPFNEDGSADEDGIEPNLEVYTTRMIPVLVALVSAWIKSELHQINWAVSQLKRSVQVELSERESSDAEDLQKSIDAERRICLRATALAHIMMRLLKTSWPKATNDVVLRTFQEMHKTLGSLTRTKINCPSLPITESYIDVLSLICSDLNTEAYTMLVEKYGNNSTEDNAADAKGNKGKGKEKSIKPKLTGTSRNSKSQVMKVSTLVSSLVFQIETTEKYVVQLGNKFKTPLSHYLKRSTARDFRIETDAIPEPISRIQGVNGRNGGAVAGEQAGEQDMDVEMVMDRYEDNVQLEEEVEVSEDESSPSTEVMDLVDIGAAHAGYESGNEDEDEEEDENENEEEDENEIDNEDEDEDEGEDEDEESVALEASRHRKKARIH
ncbi:hypothetical protein FB645_005104 [Coemansia sp. IMI 203386]|nr:hypothetical protein FB645_005104 [Coemansia sp. IMI 203386]